MTIVNDYEIINNSLYRNYKNAFVIQFPPHRSVHMHVKNKSLYLIAAILVFEALISKFNNINKS